MTDRTSLQISCSECQGVSTVCADCLVGFFTAERDATVRQFPTRTTAEPLPADLGEAFANLQAAGLDAELLDVSPNTSARAS